MSDPHSTRKTCAFCGASDVKISNEHAWPSWIRTLFPKGKNTVLAFRKPDTELGSVRYPAGDDDLGVKVNAVCRERCNSGWMNDLENKVRPFLESMIRDGCHTSLTVSQQRILATWACKTAMVFEFVSPEPPFFLQEEREVLRLGLTPPQSTQLAVAVWYARYNGPFMAKAYGAAVGLDLIQDDRVHLRAHKTAITVGQFAFEVFAVRATADFSGIVPVKDNFEDATVLGWPIQAPGLLWPPSTALDDAGIKRWLTDATAL